MRESGLNLLFRLALKAGRFKAYKGNAMRYMVRCSIAVVMMSLGLVWSVEASQSGVTVKHPVLKLPVMWEYSDPLIAPEKRQSNISRAQKDPTVVFYGGRWHVFMTVKLPGKSAIEYCSFAKWNDADRAKRTILEVSDSDYYCAPQVFYFEPHKKWYLV